MMPPSASPDQPHTSVPNDMHKYKHVLLPSALPSSHECSVQHHTTPDLTHSSAQPCTIGGGGGARASVCAEITRNPLSCSPVFCC